MFPFDSRPITVVGLLLMFAWCTIWSIVEVKDARSTTSRISTVLHLIMSAFMVLMVLPATWIPLRDGLGFPPMIAFFGLSTAWFVYVALRSTGRARLVTLGHAVMFLGMTWHVTGMSVMRAMKTVPAGTPVPASLQQQMMAIQWVGVPVMIALFVLGVEGLLRMVRAQAPAQSCGCGENCTCGPDCACGAAVPASDEVNAHALQVTDSAASSGVAGAVATKAPAVTLSCHAPRPVGSLPYRLAALSDAAMDLGMFWMSVGIVQNVMPFLKFLLV